MIGGGGGGGGGGTPTSEVKLHSASKWMEEVALEPVAEV